MTPRKRILRTTILSIFLFLIMLAVALALKLFTIGDIPFQFYAALIGAAITVVITNLLLSSQTASEFEKQKMSKVYEEKLHIYQNYIKLLCSILEKRLITNEDFSELQYQSSLVAMHTPHTVYANVMEKTETLLSCSCSKRNTAISNTTKQLLDIVLCFHNDLYNEDNNGSSTPIIKELKDIASSATTYMAKGIMGQHPGHTVAQTDFHWKNSIEKWSSMGWIKDDGNQNKDYLRLCKRDNGNASDTNVFVEILFDLSLGHYIIRAKSNPVAAAAIQEKYGGFRARDTWWKILEPPIYHYERLTFFEDFDNNIDLKEQVANWFDDIIATIG